MKNFKTLLSEIFDLESETEDIKPSSENDHGSYITRKYISKIGNDEIETRIDHYPRINSSHVKFMVNGAVSTSIGRSKRDTLNIFGTVLKHIKHHIDTAPTEVHEITYSYDDTPEGEKKDRLYQALSNKFNIPAKGKKDT